MKAVLSPISRNINKIAFAGCSISILDPDIKGFMFTDRDSIPVITPVGVISNKYNIIGIASSSIFNDTLIQKLDNKKLIINILRYINSFFKKREKDLQEKYKNINVNKAIRLLEHEIMINSKKLEQISDLIDQMWNRLNDQLQKNDIESVQTNLNKSYKIILQKIDILALQINEKLLEFGFLGQEFQSSSQELINKWYAMEAEKREKLDMIRNNLSAKIHQ